MTRLARIVAVDIPHRVAQRGNARRFIPDTDADRAVYLNLLRQNAEFHRVSMVGYCLMSNRVHLIVVPHTADGLAQVLKHTHGRYAARLGNAGGILAWSSAAAHCGSGAADECLEMTTWKGRWDVCSWQEYLTAGIDESKIAAIRQCTHAGRLLGAAEFVCALEDSMQWQLVPRKGGRPEKSRTVSALFRS